MSHDGRGATHHFERTRPLIRVVDDLGAAGDFDLAPAVLVGAAIQDEEGNGRVVDDLECLGIAFHRRGVDGEIAVDGEVHHAGADTGTRAGADGHLIDGVQRIKDLFVGVVANNDRPGHVRPFLVDTAW